MSARPLFVVLGLFVTVVQAHADDQLDHSKTRFPLSGRHQKVPCESCHPPSAGGTRLWAGVPLDCHGCHGDRRNHKGALGAQCQLCHDVSGWVSIKHQAAEHRMELVGTHRLPCASCHVRGAHLTPKVICRDCHVQPHGGTSSPCQTCHTVDNWKTVAFKKHTYDPTLLPGKHLTASCLACHPAFQFNITTTRPQCESCHRKDQPHGNLGDCKRCHSPLSWKKLALEKIAQPTSAFRVKSKFEHVAHARLVVAKGLKPTCEPCHGGISARERPPMQACERCHDGKQAFDALGTQCYRCHEMPAGAPLAALPPTPKPFRHAAHAMHDAKIDDCSSCHGAGLARKDVHAGIDQHRPCQGCHAAEFRKVGQPICLACHERDDPFRPNPLRLATAAGTEWRSPDAIDMPHAPHLTAGVACETCHLAESGVAARTPALAHAVCGKCHSAERTPRENKTSERTPVTLDRCSACHVPRSVPRWSAKRRWSTREYFRHDENHRAQACGACHLPDGVSDLAAPTMRGCATCHDGQKAFLTIGEQCARCHGAVARVN